MSHPSQPISPATYRTRRAVVAGGTLAVVGGAAALVSSIFGDEDGSLPVEQRAYCADPSALVSHATVGGARLVYEVNQRPTPLRFEPGFHSQMVAWLRDWDASSPHGGVGELWGYGAHVNKDDCKSWHAAGRALDFSRLRRGETLLVSCRTDLWGDLAEDRRRELTRRYWRLAASLNLHFTYVLTHHFDALHQNHIHVDNGVSGSGMSRFDKGSRTQNQSVQAICSSLWGREGEVSGEWSDTRRMVDGVLDELGLGKLTRQEDWQAFLRASVQRV